MTVRCHEFLYKAQLGVVVVACFGMLMGVFFWAYPFKVVEFARPYLEIENKVVYPGDTLKIKYDFKKFVNVPTKISRAFVNGIVYSVPEETVPRPAGEYKYVGFGVKVPRDLPPGRYILKTTYSYEIFPIRTISVTIDSEPFMVIPDVITYRRFP